MYQLCNFTDEETNPVNVHTHVQTQLDMNLLQITDYSPEWAFPEVCRYF